MARRRLVAPGATGKAIEPGIPAIARGGPCHARVERGACRRRAVAARLNRPLACARGHKQALTAASRAGVAAPSMRSRWHVKGRALTATNCMPPASTGALSRLVDRYARHAE